MIKVYSFRWVPPVVRGLVRDLRVRWALEELGISYENVLIGPAEQKSDAYRAMQPFGQVPVLVARDLALSEWGAIVHYLAQKSETLMPTEPEAQARVTSWMFAALNSIEPQMLFDTEFIGSRPVLLEYRKRCEGRPAVKKALADHLASFDDSLGPVEMPKST